jgi:hypothetical protein
MGTNTDMDKDIDMATDTEMDMNNPIGRWDIEYRQRFNQIADTLSDSALFSLISKIDTMFSPILFITDIGLSAHLCHYD